ncbi:unnamed protein product [Sphenostylis stenocarpa]|uniref:Uncharacterized protein n=1 Tax=Sphenostylis stenocarpa TaxID=92480 RepID=A0AA86RKC6_9FABA|nr:unnamed protein product [Sphenostylis stenocarpa]
MCLCVCRLQSHPSSSPHLSDLPPCSLLPHSLLRVPCVCCSAFPAPRPLLCDHWSTTNASTFATFAFVASATAASASAEIDLNLFIKCVKLGETPPNFPIGFLEYPLKQTKLVTFASSSNVPLVIVLNLPSTAPKVIVIFEAEPSAIIDTPSSHETSPQRISN